jgi:hypothetical protein
MKGWLTDLRKTALVALVAQAPVFAIGLNRPDLWATLAKVHGYLIFVFALIGIVVLALVATFVVFMVALYRSSAPLRISESLRLLALAAAVVNAVPLLTYSYRWIHFFVAPSLLQRPASARSLIEFVIILISGVAYALFLIAIARHRNASERGASNDRLLARMALIGTIVWGVILVCILLTEPYLAFQYRSWRELALERRVDIPPLSSILWERFRDWLQQAVLFVPFYIVQKSLVNPPVTAGASAPEANGFDTPESPTDQA